jgi:GT2 family glycosyltransferase/glycosyltransferase involved in cell wall biosynthesis
MRLRYYIDSPNIHLFARENPLFIRGWFVDEQGRAARQVRARVGRNTRVAIPEARPDLIASNIEAKPGDKESGFHLRIKTGAGLKYVCVEAVTCDGRVVPLWRRILWMPPASPYMSGTKHPRSIPWGCGQKHFLNEALGCQIEAAAQTPGPQPGGAVTVVVPIYNAADHLRRCLTSLSEHLPAQHDIILIDDCSPDAQIAAMCRDFVNSRARARYERNPVNLGFVGTCNRAIFELDHTANDILLLNSDTEMTAGALPELQAVLRASDRHFAVCPRSNQATILSFPRNHSCDAETSFTLWREAKSQLPRYQIIPTFVGFCALLRRDLLNLFGGLDPAYGRGYNEENDLAARANRFGYSSVAANHAYVFHHEGQSFGAERVALDQKNRNLLLDRYPEYGETDSFWCDLALSPAERFARPVRPIKRVLIDLTEMPDIYNGSSIYCLDVSAALAKKLRGQVEIAAWTKPAAAAFHRAGLSVLSDVRTEHPQNGEVFDLVFAPMQIWKKEQLAICLRLAPRLVWTLHDIISLRCNYLFDPARWSALREALKLADATIAISDYTRDDARAFFGPLDRVTTIRNGPGRDWKYIPATSDRVLIVGNRYAHKAIAETLWILRHLADHIDVLGPVDAVPDFSTRGHASGNLPQATIDGLMQTAKVLVFPSLYEGFGYPAYEGSVRGKIVIVHDNPLNRELSRAGLLRNTLFFNSFHQLPALVEQARLATPLETPAPADDERMASEYASLILDRLSRPPDHSLLERRWQWTLSNIHHTP